MKKRRQGKRERVWEDPDQMEFCWETPPRQMTEDESLRSTQATDLKSVTNSHESNTNIEGK